MAVQSLTRALAIRFHWLVAKWSRGPSSHDKRLATAALIAACALASPAAAQVHYDVVSAFGPILPNGGNPHAGLIQASDGSFYGTTVNGGFGYYGTVFKVDSAGTLTTLYSFSFGSDGGNPTAGLIQASDGSFYGTTIQGGASGAGTVFKVDGAGTLTTLHSFSAGSDGGNP